MTCFFCLAWICTCGLEICWSVLCSCSSIGVKWHRGVFAVLVCVGDRCRAVCLSVKINSNVKWQSVSLRIGTCHLSPEPPLAIGLRSMILSFTPRTAVHYPKNRYVCVCFSTCLPWCSVSRNASYRYKVAAPFITCFRAGETSVLLLGKTERWIQIKKSDK